MGAVNTTYTFTATDTITSSKMNNIIDQTTMTTDAISGTTLEVASGQLKVRAQGITSNEMATGSITANAIADGVITNAKISSSTAIDLSKLATGALPTSITIAPENFSGGLVPTEAIEDAAITAPKLDGEQIGTAPIYGVRAWVNFNGITSANLGGTYSRSGTTNVTVTATAHGLIAGNRVFLDFTVGTGTAPFDGIYEVATIVDVNSFTVVSSTTTTSTGTVLLKMQTIRGSGNVSCVSAAQSSPTIPPTSNQTVDHGYYIINFLTARPNSNFAIAGITSESGTLTTASGNDILGGFGFNEKCAYVTTINVASAATNCLYNNVMVIG